MPTQTKQKSVKKKKPKTVYDEHLKMWMGQVEKDFDLAMKIYRAQDTLTQETIDRIQHRLLVGANGMVKVGDKTFQVEEEAVNKNAFRAAVRIMQDLAAFDIRVANFKVPGGHCKSCGKKLSSRKRKPAKK